MTAAKKIDARDDEDDPPPVDAAPDVDLERKAGLAMRLAIPLGTIACAALAGAIDGAPLAVLVLAGGALLTVIAIFWASLRTLLGEAELTGADAYAMAAPRAEEEQKRAVLRALKDLEFEKSVGKISDEDYRDLVARYRAEAKRLLKVLDESAPKNERAEALVAARLAKAGFAAEIVAARVAKDAPPDAPVLESPPSRLDSALEAADEAADAPPSACDACGTTNDVDAVFCKKCGKKCGAQPVDEDAP
ncbi:MAG TPA: zinc ribbon domain-containing protein [Byssovorax sp.]|jgi:hypothetical protein